MNFLTDFAITLILYLLHVHLLALPWGVSVEVRPYFLNRDQDGSSEKI